MATGLFEVLAQNRVVKGAYSKRIIGTQGSWHSENLLYLADSEKEAEGYAIEEINSRRILGMTRRRKKKSRIRREVEVIDVRRIG